MKNDISCLLFCNFRIRVTMTNETSIFGITPLIVVYFSIISRKREQDREIVYVYQVIMFCDNLYFKLFDFN